MYFAWNLHKASETGFVQQSRFFLSSPSADSWDNVTLSCSFLIIHNTSSTSPSASQRNHKTLKVKEGKPV